MRWIRAVSLAFSTYTRIPMPQVRWDDESMNLAIVFLPLVGVAIGCVVWLWQILCHFWGLGPVLFAAITVVIPIFVTGGIHMDGYCDTSDAFASWKDKEHGLEILKDPHVGAFALIRYGVYMLISFAFLYEIYTRGYGNGIGGLYVVSRCFAAWSAMTMPNARKSGMLAAVTPKIDRRAAVVVLLLLTAAGLAGFSWLSYPYGLIGILLCLPVTFWYGRVAKKRFGGVTGDTTGYYLQLVELTLIVGLLLGGLISEWL